MFFMLSNLPIRTQGISRLDWKSRLYTLACSENIVSTSVLIDNCFYCQQLAIGTIFMPSLSSCSYISHVLFGEEISSVLVKNIKSLHMLLMTLSVYSTLSKKIWFSLQLMNMTLYQQTVSSTFCKSTCMEMYVCFLLIEQLINIARTYLYILPN